MQVLGCAWWTTEAPCSDETNSWVNHIILPPSATTWLRWPTAVTTASSCWTPRRSVLLRWSGMTCIFDDHIDSVSGRVDCSLVSGTAAFSSTSCQLVCGRRRQICKPHVPSRGRLIHSMHWHSWTFGRPGRWSNLPPFRLRFCKLESSCLKHKTQCYSRPCRWWL